MSYRVIQWATGAMGKTVLREVLDHPAMELVGLYVYGQDKAGRDAGEIARRDLTGVIATRDVDEILALDADVVVHCARLAPPYGSHDEEIARILASGKNVISINGYARPEHWQGERRAALEAACAAGGTTLMAAGLNPGFAGEQIAMIATGVCSDVDHVRVEECASAAEVVNPVYVFDVLGFGADPETVDPNDPAWGPADALNGMYEETLSAMAQHLGMTLERVESDHRVFPATMDLTVAAGEIARGTISHVNWRWHGIVAGERRLTMAINWYMETAHLDVPDPPLWRISVEGQPAVNVSVSFAKRQGDTTRVSAEQIAVAGSVINTIPLVCAAPVGLAIRPVATPPRARGAARG